MASSITEINSFLNQSKELDQSRKQNLIIDHPILAEFKNMIHAFELPDASVGYKEYNRLTTTEQFLLKEEIISLFLKKYFNHTKVNLFEDTVFLRLDHTNNAFKHKIQPHECIYVYLNVNQLNILKNKTELSFFDAKTSSVFNIIANYQENTRRNFPINNKLSVDVALTFGLFLLAKS